MQTCFLWFLQDNLTMHYVGTLKSDGSEFDSSIRKGRPFRFTIGIGRVSSSIWTKSALNAISIIAHAVLCILSQVIKGWDEGVAQMSLGEKAVLDITSDYGT